LLSQITGNGSINVYGWLFMGLCIAASREALETTRAGVARAVAPVLSPARPRWAPRQLASRARR